MKSRVRDVHDGLRPEYHFDYSEAVRGKYSKRLATEGSNIVVLDPDVAKAFRDSNAVNDALRALLELTDATRRLTARSRGAPRKWQRGQTFDMKAVGDTYHVRKTFRQEGTGSGTRVGCAIDASIESDTQQH